MTHDQFKALFPEAWNKQTQQNPIMSKPKTQTPEPIIERKVCKHLFTDAERISIGDALARCHDQATQIAAEFEQVKRGFKAREAECDARIGKLSSDIVNGFDMREQECIVVFRPKDRKKDYYLNQKIKETGYSFDLVHLVLTEDMTTDDFNMDLIRVEKMFAHRAEIPLFVAGADQGTIIVGQMKNKWHGCLRVIIGEHKLDERLNTEALGYKVRFDAVRKTGERLMLWLSETLGKEAAKGFEDPILKAIDAEKEKVQ